MLYLNRDVIKRPGLVTTAVSIILLAMVASLIPKAIESEGKGAEAWNLTWAPEVGITFGFFIDPLALITALVITGLSAVAGIYMITYYRGKHALPNAGAYNAGMLMFLGGMLGVIFATDIIEFYLFWEFMVIPTYFLVAFWGEAKEKSKAIAIKYFVYMHIGAMLLLFGVLWHYSLQPSGLATTNIYLMKAQLAQTTVSVEILRVIAILVSLGFGVKMSIFPFHSWLPETYENSPIHTTIMIGPVMVSLGIYGLVRFLYSLFDIETIKDITLLLMALGVITQFYGGIMAIGSKSMKTFLGYSSMSQMGYIYFAIGTAVFIGVEGSIFHIVNHGIAKVLLFMVVGVVILATGARKFDELGGLLEKMPLTAIAAAIGVLAIAGIPPLAGFQSEWLMLAAGFGTDYLAIAILSVVATVFSMGYALWFMKRIFFGVPMKGIEKVEEAPVELIAPLFVLAAAAIAIGIFPYPIYQLAQAAARGVGLI